MKVFHQFSSAGEEAISNELVRQNVTDTLAVFSDLVVPLFADKSSKQTTIDLVHPVLNTVAEYWFSTLGWKLQGVLNDIADGAIAEKGTVDFYFRMPDGRYSVIEVQFGNMGRLHRDYVKMRKLHKLGKLAMGYLVYFDRDTAKTADSGICEYEKALEILDDYQELPLCVVGLSRQDSPTVDLRVIPGLVFPTILGGSGKHAKVIQAQVAQAIVDRRPLETLELSPAHKAIIARHAKGHTATAIKVFMDTVGRALACEDVELRDELLAMLVPIAKTSSAQLNSQVGKKPTKPRTKRAACTKPAAPVHEAVTNLEEPMPALTPGGRMLAAAPGCSGTPLIRVKKESMPVPRQMVIPVASVPRKPFINSQMGHAFSKLMPLMA